MIGHIQNLKKYFYAIFIKESCIILLFEPQKWMKMFWIWNIILIAWKHLQGVYFQFIITIYRSEPCRCRFSIFEKKSSIFFERQKANSLTFCSKMSSYRHILPNRDWNRVEWTQEMVFNTYHHIRTCLDKKNRNWWKKVFKFFSLPISLRATLKLSLRSRFSAKKHFFVFIEISLLTLKYRQIVITRWKSTSKLSLE